MKFNSSARFNRKSFNSEKLFDAGIHDATITNEIPGFSICECVSNGGFEAGDISDWTEQKSSTGSAIASNNPTYIYSGNFGCLITTANATTFPNNYQYVGLS